MDSQLWRNYPLYVLWRYLEYKKPWRVVVDYRMLIWCHFGSLMISGIIPPFKKRWPLSPLVLLFKGKASQIGFKTFVDCFSLTICLWMERCTHLTYVLWCLNSSFQNLLVNVGSRLNKVEVGMPWILKIGLEKFEQ